MNTINIIVAEDHTIVREGMRALLEPEEDIKIIGEAADGRATVKMAKELVPDVIVMDIAMPLLNGIEATRQILRDRPDTKILILTAHSDEAYVEKVMELGAKGYLTKQSSSHLLAESIRGIFHGGKCFSPAIALHLNRHEQKAQGNGDLHAKKGAGVLSSREAEVLQLIAEGNANKQTADVLNISIKTVEKHRQSLMNKLNIHDTAGLTRYAIEKGIIESSVQVTII